MTASATDSDRATSVVVRFPATLPVPADPRSPAAWPLILAPLPDKLYAAIDGTSAPVTPKETAGRQGKGHMVTQVASRLGYSSPASFTAAFSRTFGVTPSALARSGARPAHKSR